MTLEEMRRVHGMAFPGEWTREGGYVRCGEFFIADVTLGSDAAAVVMAHNKFAKLLAVAEAAKALDGLDVWRHANLLNARLATLLDALDALEES